MIEFSRKLSMFDSDSLQLISNGYFDSNEGNVDIFWNQNGSSLDWIWPVKGLHLSSTQDSPLSANLDLLFEKTSRVKLSSVGANLFYSHLPDSKPTAFLLDHLQLCRNGFTIQAFHLSIDETGGYSLNLIAKIQDSACSAALELKASKPLRNQFERLPTITCTISPTYGYHSRINLNLASFEDQLTRTHLVAHFTKSFIADPYELKRIDFGDVDVVTIGDVDLEVASNSIDAHEHFVMATFNLGYTALSYTLGVSQTHR